MANPVELARRARYAVESYRSVEEWPDPKQYLSALTEALDDLCEVVGMEPPTMPEGWVRGE